LRRFRPWDRKVEEIADSKIASSKKGGGTMKHEPTREALEQKVAILERRVFDLEKDQRMSREAGEILQEKAGPWRVLFEQSRDGIVIIDLLGNVFEANTRFADMLGYTHEEVRTLHVWDWDALYTKSEIQNMLSTVDLIGVQFETRHRRKDGAFIDVELSNSAVDYQGRKLILCLCRDITERKRMERERDQVVKELEEALAENNTLKGILPICAHCKKIRNHNGDWEQVEEYVRDRSEAEFSHGICPECIKTLYPGVEDKP